MSVADAWSAWVARLDGRGWGAGGMLRPPAPDTALLPAIEVVGPLPDDLVVLYRCADGQRSVRETDGLATNLFPGYEFLPLERARRAWDGWADIRRTMRAEDFDDAITVRGADPVRRVYTLPAWWPFAEDGGGNHLMVDLDPAPGGTVGQVIVAGPDEDQRRVLAPGVAAYLDALLVAPLDPPQPDALADDVAWWDAPQLR